MSQMARFSTAGVPPSDRVTFWNRIGSEVYRDQVVVTPRPGASFGGVLLARSYDCVSLTQVTTAASTVRGEPHGTAAQDSEYAAVMLQDAGTSDNVANGRTARLQPGMVAASLRPLPYTITFEATARCIFLRLPTSRLAARIGDQGGQVATAADAALLISFLRTLLARQEPAGDAGAEAAISDVVLDLIAIAFRRSRGTRTAPPVTLAERWQATVREFVDLHLDDPELGAPMIADRLGVTPRYVQMVFAKMATTASGYIVERRLERAARLLVSKREPIASVAHQVGFSDLSYFYRSFRKRYGVSPGRYISPPTLSG